MKTILFSPSTKRVIWNNGAMTFTTQLSEDFSPEKHIHAAPIDEDSMAEAFTNEEIGDFEERSINLWTDLNN
jgi:hypothetical protein